MKFSDLRSDTRGYALLSVITIVSALLIAGIATVKMTRTELRGTADSVAYRKAFYVAESGVQRGLARLSQDRATAATSTAYTYSTSNQSFGEGAYSISIVQDPYFPTDTTRKQVTAVGTVANQQATVVNQAIVQTAPPSTLCFTDTGKCRIETVAALASGLFNGEIFSNNDVEIAAALAVAVEGSGNIYARNRFRDEGLSVAGINNITTGVLSTMDAQLFSGVAYTPAGLLGLGIDIHLLGPLARLGIHFANGALNHGQTQAIAARPFPQVDWEALRRDTRTVIVNAENVPFGSWDSASGTWVVGSIFAPPVDSDEIYYIEGNAHIVSLQLVKGAKMTIAARGWSAIESLNVLSLGLLSGSRQDLRVITQGKNTIGLKVLAYAPLQLESTLNALSPTLDMALGIGLDVASVLNTDNRLFAYSERDDVWAKVSTLSATNGSHRMSLIAKNNATIAYTLHAANDNRIAKLLLPYQ